MPQDPKPLINLPTPSAPFKGQQVNDPIRDFLLGAIGWNEPDPTATVATNIGGLASMSPLGKLGKLGGALFKRAFKGPSVTSLGRLDSAAKIPVRGPTDPRITGLPPLTIDQPKIHPTDTLGDDRLFRILQERMEQRRVKDIANPPQPKPRNPNQPGGAGPANTQKPSYYDADVDNWRPTTNSPRDEGEIRRLNAEANNTMHHSPALPLRTGGTSVYDPAQAKEKARLMISMLGEGDDPNAVETMRAMFSKAPRTMGHVDQISFGDDAVKSLSGAHKDLPILPRGDQSSVNTAFGTAHRDFDTGGKRSVINLSPDARPFTGIHELTHAGQQIKYGDDFGRLYAEAGGSRGPSYRTNKFEINANHAANKFVNPNETQISRIIRRLAKPYQNLEVNDADGIVRKLTSNAPAEHWLLEKDIVLNDLNEYFNNPKSRKQLIDNSDRRSHMNWRRQYLK